LCIVCFASGFRFRLRKTGASSAAPSRIAASAVHMHSGRKMCRSLVPLLTTLSTVPLSRCPKASPLQRRQLGNPQTRNVSEEQQDRIARTGRQRHETPDTSLIDNPLQNIVRMRWALIPKDPPPRSTVNDYFCLWSHNGTLEKIYDALYVKYREQAEREASPTACIIDSQSVKSAEKGGACIDPHAFDAGKLINGKKRHVLVDAVGLLLDALVTSADVQDRDGGLLALSTLFARFPFLKTLFTDGAYAGPVFQDGLKLTMPGLITEIVRRCDQAKGFDVLPQRALHVAETASRS
jgi:transposase